jgi:membrane protein
MANYKDLWSLLRQTVAEWSDHEAPRLGAALAFYSVLSLAPLVILIMGLMALILGHTAAQNQILGQVEGLIGHDGAKAVQGMIEHGQKPSTDTFASIIGIFTLLFGASGVFGELRGALNKMWDVKPKAGSGIWVTIRERVFSFGMVLAIGFLLLVSLGLSAILAALGKFLGGLLPMPEFVLSGIDLVVSLAGVAILFALIFKYLPETEIAWHEVWVGAVATAILFTVGKFLIGLYLGKAAVGSAYGEAGSLIVVIVWVYYSSMIFLFGAEFTHVLAQRSRPSEKIRAVRMSPTGS